MREYSFGIEGSPILLSFVDRWGWRLVFLWFCSGFSITGAEPLGTDFLREVLHRRPTIVQSQKQLGAAEINLRASRLQPNPTLTLSATSGDAGESANALTQNFEISGQPHLRWRVTQARLDVAQQRLHASQRGITALAYSAWLEAWLSYRLTELAQLRQTLMMETVRAARRRFEVGEIAENEALRVELAAAQAETNLIRNSARLRKARRNIALLLGSEPDFPAVANTLPTKPPSLLNETSLKEILSSGEASPRIAAQVSELEAKRHSAKLLGKQRAPILGLSAYRSDLFRTGQIEQGVQLSLSWPLMDWGRIARSVERRQVEAEAFEAGVEASRLQLRQELSALWTSLEAARENRKVLLIQARRYEELAREARIAYDLGMLNLTDLLQTESSFRKAGVDLIEADAEVLGLEVSLWNKSGLPLPVEIAEKIL